MENDTREYPTPGETWRHYQGKMANEIVPFIFDGIEVRTAGTFDRPLFVVMDVCNVLGIKDASDASERIPDDWKDKVSIPTLGGNQEMLCVLEPGLYELVFASRKDVAKRFRRWVMEDVIPTIRKTGKYELPAHPPQPIALPPTLADMAAAQQAIAAFQSTGDLQLAQLMKIHMANELLRHSQNTPLLQGAIEEPMQLEGAVDIAVRMGYRVNKSQEGSLGKFVKKICGDLIQGKNQRYSQASAKQIPANMYPANHPEVESAVRAFFS